MESTSSSVAPVENITEHDSIFLLRESCVKAIFTFSPGSTLVTSALCAISKLSTFVIF